MKLYRSRCITIMYVLLVRKGNVMSDCVQCGCKLIIRSCLIITLLTSLHILMGSRQVDCNQFSFHSP